jgi:hypothetical protein
VSVLGEQLLNIHHALAAGGVPHAFGGAIALAYCTEEPRGTRDLDVNVFTGVDRAPEVLACLPAGIGVSDADLAAIERDGQVRLWWDDTPVDLFFDVHEFHLRVAEGVREVPFSGDHIPVLGCTALAVFKVMFDRTRDWADIEAMLATGALNGFEALGWAVRLLGADDGRVARLSELLA